MCSILLQHYYYGDGGDFHQLQGNSKVNFFYKRGGIKLCKFVLQFLCGGGGYGGGDFARGGMRRAETTTTAERERERENREKYFFMCTIVQ